MRAIFRDRACRVNRRSVSTIPHPRYWLPDSDPYRLAARSAAPLGVFSPEVVDTSSRRGAGLFECCGAGQRARLADQCLEVVVEFEVGFESAGEPVVSSDLLVAVEDHQVVGVQQDPDLPVDQPHRHRVPPDRSEQLDLAPGACCRSLREAAHTASSSDDRDGSRTSWNQFRDQARGAITALVTSLAAWRKRA